MWRGCAWLESISWVKSGRDEKLWLASPSVSLSSTTFSRKWHFLSRISETRLHCIWWLVNFHLHTKFWLDIWEVIIIVKLISWIVYLNVMLSMCTLHTQLLAFWSKCPKLHKHPWHWHIFLLCFSYLWKVYQLLTLFTNTLVHIR